MKPSGFVFLSLIATGLLSLAAEPKPASPAVQTNFDAFREQLKQMTPEERAARVREWRDRRSGPPRDEWERRRDELKNLSPEEREAKLKAWRDKAGAERAQKLKQITPEEREAKRREIRERLEKQLEPLRQKQSVGAIIEEEATRLRRLEQIYRRFDTNAVRQAQPGATPPARALAPTSAPGREKDQTKDQP